MVDANRIALEEQALNTLYELLSPAQPPLSFFSFGFHPRSNLVSPQLMRIKLLCRCSHLFFSQLSITRQRNVPSFE
jgi:hypothetical protein